MSASLLAQGLNAALETVLNNYLRLDPDARQRMQALAGKVIAVEFQDLNCTLYLLPGAEDMEVRSAYEGAADTTLRGTAWALLRLGLQKKGAQATLSSGAVRISGDVELGRRFKRILDDMEIDWEELLSKVTGDVAAHQIGDAVRAAKAWGESVLKTLGQNFAEYQQEEARNVPASAEMEIFLQAVDVLRDDVERMAQRVRRLQEHLESERESGK